LPSQQHVFEIISAMAELEKGTESVTNNVGSGLGIFDLLTTCLDENGEA
jgi:hypothetical protein